MSKTYEKRIGTRTILNTNFPVLAVATGSKRKWSSFILCNGLVESHREHATRRDAQRRVDYLAQPDYEPSADAELWPPRG